MSDVAGTGHRTDLTLETILAGLEHFLGEVDRAIARGFRTDQGTTPVATFARQHRREFIGQLLILAKHEANFATTDADVPSGNIGPPADMAEQFAHE